MPADPRSPAAAGNPQHHMRLFPFHTVVLGALIPAFIFSIGIGAMLPIIAPHAVQQGATLAVAGVIAAMLPVGQILADIPAGALASRIGDRPAMLLAGGTACLGLLGAALADSLIALALAILLVGAANAVFHLARHSYLTEITPPMHRARVLSTLGGVHRIGQFVGPFIGALVLQTGDLRLVFLLATATAAAASVTVALSRPEERRRHPDQRRSDSEAEDAVVRPSLRTVLRDHRALLLTLGVPVLLVGCIRGARQQVIPLWGEHLGLDPATISIIYGIAGGIDMLLFYPAGKIMDHFGRLWMGVPAMVVLGLAMALVPLTQAAAQLTWVAVALGLGNGLGSGIMMTVASDVAPSAGRPQFLGAWRLLQDLGIAAGPLIIAAGAALGSLAAGIWVAAAMGPAAGAALQRWLPRWSVHANRTTRRRAGLL
ncbi:MFS transporter [Nesterenkonia sp. HG001]|uniref:MFS transporter n=1 Tax=Nesterenkonia sp. HG001 TaxID=2983207 RepID=UPI002AC7885C|nr:MFS transporter [Nesterenkonia sp. HG001]MDZ5078460.1 MFS transporter [Nesterenkonia sp. HG001]